MDENIEELKSTGLKATTPRLKILEVFQNAERRHLSAEDVYRILIEDGSDIGLATVYRVLGQFEQACILTRNYFEPNKAVYELHDDDHHDHIICVDCGHVVEFYDPEIERRQKLVAEQHGFEIVEHALSIYGRCVKKECPYRSGEALPDRQKD